MKPDNAIETAPRIISAILVPVDDFPKVIQFLRNYISDKWFYSIAKNNFFQ